jgi:hypothetical protein
MVKRSSFVSEKREMDQLDPLSRHPRNGKRPTQSLLIAGFPFHQEPSQRSNPDYKQQ